MNEANNSHPKSLEGETTTARKNWEHSKVRIRKRIDKVVGKWKSSKIVRIRQLSYCWVFKLGDDKTLSKVP